MEAPTPSSASNDPTFGKHLKRVMKVLGIIQDALKEPLNVGHQGQVSKIVNDLVEPTPEQILAVATFCKCSPWTLIGGTTLVDKVGGECIVSVDPETHILLAYYASALTGLDDDQRGAVFGDAEIVREACEGMQTLLYEPADYTDPKRNAKLPAERVYEIDHAQVSRSDFLVLNTRFPSFGAGQELEIAKNQGIPVVLLIPRRVQPSRMVLGTCARLHPVEFSDVNELHRALAITMPQLQNDMLARRRPRPATVEDSFAARMKARREKLHLDYAAIGRHIGLAAHGVEQLEKGLCPNPSLAILEGLANALCTSVSYLVDGVMRHLEDYDPTLRRSKDNLTKYADAHNLTRHETQELWTAHMVEFSTHRYSVAEARTEAVTEADWQSRHKGSTNGRAKQRSLALDNDQE